ncbi:hypothetical protein [Polaribacter porphyrae]|uniref:Uncharacterized protein n=1 Tax=Polaribacter porphyrae TaxID=1137780 RepID=A0A2S7WMN9_9FLAO|nr:hypothetical protein [Polaribacter porphyrae]PQJ78887.1 hypothetical protein BTO18_06675 [Polaribacter porphyrae]
MKKITVLLFLISIFSCKEKFNPKEFKGTWIPLDKNSSYANLPSITFQNDTAYFEDIYSYNFSARYKIGRKSITWFLPKDTIENIFFFNKKDTTFILNDRNYIFYEGYSYGSNFIQYDLIDLDLSREISADSLLNSNKGFHIFKNKNDSLRLRINDRITTDFKLIPRFIFGTHHRNYDTIVIYLGKKLELKELIKAYKYLDYSNIKNSMLVTNFNIKSNTYNAFLDKFYFWDFQRNSFFDERIEIPNTFVNKRDKFLKKYNPKIIKINSKNDFEKINKIQKENNYLISINPDLSIKEYINLKEKLFKIDKNIRTEFDI